MHSCNSATTCISWIVVKCIKLLFLWFPWWVLLGLRSIILSDSTGSHKVCFSHFAVSILTSSFLQTFSGLGHSLIVWGHVHCTTYAQPIPCFTSPPGSTITNGVYCDPLFCSAILICAAFFIFISLFSWSLFPVCVYTFALYLFHSATTLPLLSVYLIAPDITSFMPFPQSSAIFKCINSYPFPFSLWGMVYSWISHSVA